MENGLMKRFVIGMTIGFAFVTALILYMIKDVGML